MGRTTGLRARASRCRLRGFRRGCRQAPAQTRATATLRPTPSDPAAGGEATAALTARATAWAWDGGAALPAHLPTRPPTPTPPPPPLRALLRHR
eukprot:5389359-Pleurochrysis_carterae.AAC.2